MKVSTPQMSQTYIFSTTSSWYITQHGCIDYVQTFDSKFSFSHEISSDKAAETTCRRAANTTASTPDPNPALEANVNHEPIPGPAAEMRISTIVATVGDSMKKKQKNVNFGLDVKDVTAGSMVCVLALLQAMNLRFISVRVVNINKTLFCMSINSVWVGTGMGNEWGFDLRMMP